MVFCRLVAPTRGALQSCRVWGKVGLCPLPSQEGLGLLWVLLWELGTPAVPLGGGIKEAGFSEDKFGGARPLKQ